MLYNKVPAQGKFVRSNDTPAAIAGRLKAAREMKGLSVRALQRDLKKRGVRGSSPTMVFAYARGEARPPLEFIRAAADLLNVNARWLESGEGSPTEAVQAARGVPLRVAKLRKAVEQALSQNFASYGRLDPIARASIWEVWQVFVRSELDQTKTARRVGKAFAEPLKLLQRSGDEMQPWELRMYVMLTAQALIAAAPETNRAGVFTDDSLEEEAQ